MEDDFERGRVAGSRWRRWSVLAGLAALTAWWALPGSSGAAVDVLVVGTAGALNSVQPSTGEITATVAEAVASPDPRTLVTARRTGGSASSGGVEVLVVATDAATGDQRWTRRVGIPFGRVSLVGADGLTVVLDADGALGGPYRPVPRARTELTLSRPDGSWRTFALEGNHEPEALSRDGQTLFLLSYVPPLAPERYQVRRLDLRTGELGDVVSPDGHLQQEMGGTARTQAWAPDGGRLYTLYTLDRGGRQRAFIHVLDLVALWAHCIELPGAFARADERATGLAVSPDGRRLHAVDARGGLVAVADTARLALVETAPFDAGGLPPGAARALVDGAGRLVVASGTGGVTLAGRPLQVTARWGLPGVVVGLQEGVDGTVRAVLADRRVMALDPTTGKAVATAVAEVAGEVEAVGGGPARQEVLDKGLPCAC